MTDFTGEAAPVDDFKKEHIINSSKKNEVADKPTSIIRPKCSNVK